MNAEIWENEIVDQLKLIDNKYFVEVFPNKPSTYLVKGERGSVLVRYNRSEYKKIEVVGYVEERKVEMEIVLKARSLRGNNGAYDMMEKIKESLRQMNLSKLLERVEIKSDDTIGEEQGVWTFGYKIQFKVMEFNEKAGIEEN